MNNKTYLILKQSGFDTGFHNIFIENNSDKFDRFVELIREDERVQAGSDIQIACANGDLPDVCEDAADFIAKVSLNDSNL